jgi:hypothetical protein
MISSLAKYIVIYVEFKIGDCIELEGCCHSYGWAKRRNDRHGGIDGAGGTMMERTGYQCIDVIYSRREPKDNIKEEGNNVGDDKIPRADGQQH